MNDPSSAFRKMFFAFKAYFLQALQQGGKVIQQFQKNGKTEPEEI